MVGKVLLQKLWSPKFAFLHKHFNNRNFVLLDIGAGNHSASKTKSLFPNCTYHGLDIDRDYSNSENDFKAMDFFYEMDLTKLDYSSIPNNYFDCILINHVIEHLHNGEEVLVHLLPKLKPNGLMYIEYPGSKSTKLPSMYGTLNFYDDLSHVRIYSAKELQRTFTMNDCEVLNLGIRRNFLCIAAMPFRILSALLKGSKIQGNFFWDFLGFAEFLQVRKRA
jgi:SAM-dependent methyltransferase